MEQVLPFLIFISAGLLLSELFRRFHVPYVVALILAGMLIGPYGFNIISLNETFEFFASVGLIFLMFMAGLEIKLSGLRSHQKDITRIAAINGALPFLTGFLLTHLFGYDFISSFLIGIIFMSSSVAVIIPSMQAKNLLSTKIGKTIIGATIIEDLVGLLILSLILHHLTPITSVPLPFFLFTIVGAIVSMKLAIPKLKQIIFAKKENTVVFEQELTFAFVSLLAVVTFFESLGLHSIVAGFLTGLVMSDSITHLRLKRKLHAISYGLFIPAFFIIIGMQTNISLLYTTPNALPLTLSILVCALIIKFITGYIGAIKCGFSKNEAGIFGSATMPLLGTALAVVYIGNDLHLIDSALSVSIIFLGIVTTVAGPLIIPWYTARLKEN
jgi:Kef-type K+ transport system membrane component KefB